MFAALLCTFCFSISAIYATKTTRLLGAIEALFWRSVLSTVLFLPVLFIFNRPEHDPSLFYFILSGIIGNGFADIAMFQALKRVGARLTMLIMQCLAAPFAILIEWFWLDTKLSFVQLVCVTVILAGVFVALKPHDSQKISKAYLLSGCIFGVVSGFFQGFGAVLSRKAFLALELVGSSINPLLASFERVAGGLVVIAIFYFLTQFLWTKLKHRPALFANTVFFKKCLQLVLLNVIVGQIVGIGLFQWALQTTPSGIILPIIATTPIVVIPLARLIDGERANLSSLVGGVIAVVGVIGLKLM